MQWPDSLNALGFRGNACRFWTFHELPSPMSRPLVRDSRNELEGREGKTNHFKGIQLLFNLLRENRCQAIARGRLSPSVILAAGPCLVELNTWTKNDGLDNTVLRPRSKVIVALSFFAVFWSAWATRVGRITTVGCFLCWPRHGRRTSRVCR